MMSRMKCLAAIGVFVGSTLLPAPVHAATILVNGGFETGSLNPWIVAGGTPIVTNTEAHTGFFSVAALSGDFIFQSFAAGSTADITEVSFWVKRLGGAFNAVQLFYGDGTSNVVIINALGATNEWQFFDITADLLPGKNLGGFLITGASPGPAYLDDFTITTRTTTTVPEPASVLLFGTGLLAAAARRRRRRS